MAATHSIFSLPCTSLAILVAITAYFAPCELSSQTTTAKNAYTLAGTVLGSDGQVASKSTIRFRDGMGDWEQTEADENGQFSFQIKCIPHAIINFYSADRSEVLCQEFRNNNIADRIKVPLEIQLVPAVSVPVTVKQNGTPIKGASVIGRTKEFGWNFAPEKTDDQGKAAITIPARHQLGQIWAIESQTGLGGLTEFAVNPTENSTIELMPKRKRTVLVLDGNEKPINGVRVKINLNCRDQSKATGQLPELIAVTDEKGMAKFDWIPSDDQWGFRAGVHENPKYNWDYMRKHELNQFFITGPDQDLRVVYLKPKPARILVTGTIQGLPGERAGIKVLGNGIGAQSQSDLANTVTDSDGNFSLKLMPGLVYALGITDDKWACDIVVLKIPTESKTATSLTLAAYPAVPLTIQVTQGRNNLPVRDMSVQHFQFKKVDMGPGLRGTLALAQGKILDKNGLTVFGSASGLIRINMGIQKWQTSKDVNIVKGAPMTLEFHAPAIGAWTVAGTIAAPETDALARLSNQIGLLDSKQRRIGSNDEIELEKLLEKKKFLVSQVKKHQETHVGNCEVTIFNPRLSQTIAVAQTDEKGNWKAEVEGDFFFAHVVSADGKFAAFHQVDAAQNSDEKIKLEPTVKVSGKLTTPDGTPHVNQEIFLSTDVQEGVIWHSIKYASTTTDEEGRFEFPLVPTSIVQRIAIQNLSGNLQHLTPHTRYQPDKNVSELELIYQQRVARPVRRPNR